MEMNTQNVTGEVMEKKLAQVDFPVIIEKWPCGYEKLCSTRQCKATQQGQRKKSWMLFSLPPFKGF